MARLPDRRIDLLAGVEHHKAGRLDRAEALYRKVLAKSPADADAHNLLGTVALARGRPVRAIQLLEKAVALAPAFAPAYSNLGNAYRAAGRQNEAANAYRRAIALSPDLADAHSNLAQVLNDLGEAAQALDCAQRQQVDVSRAAADQGDAAQRGFVGSGHGLISSATSTM